MMRRERPLELMLVSSSPQIGHVRQLEYALRDIVAIQIEIRKRSNRITSAQTETQTPKHIDIDV